MKQVDAGHVRVHLFEGAGFDQGMNPLTRTDGEVMLAMSAYLEVLIQFLVENHGAAFRALGPKPLGDLALFRFGCKFGLFNEGRVGVCWRWRDGGFGGLQAKRLLREKG